MQFTKITGSAMRYIEDGGFDIKDNIDQIMMLKDNNINKYLKIDDYYVHYDTFYDEVFPQLTDEEKQKSIKDILYPPKYAKCRRIKRESTILSSSSDSEDDVKEEVILPEPISVDEPSNDDEPWMQDVIPPLITFDDPDETKTDELTMGAAKEDEQDVETKDATDKEIKTAITDYKKNNPEKTLSDLIRYIREEYDDDIARKYNNFMRKCRLQFLTSIELPTEENSSFRIALKEGKKLKFVVGEYTGSILHVDDWGGISENLHSDAKEIIKDKVTYIS